LPARTAKLAEPAKKPAPVTKMQIGYASVPHEARHPLPARHRAAGRRKPNLADTRRFTQWPDLPTAA